MNWFHELSSLELAFFVVGVTIAVAIAGLALVAPRVRVSGLHARFDNATITGLLSALILLVLLAVWHVACLLYTSPSPRD